MKRLALNMDLTPKLKLMSYICCIYYILTNHNWLATTLTDIHLCYLQYFSD